MGTRKKSITQIHMVHPHVHHKKIMLGYHYCEQNRFCKLTWKWKIHHESKTYSLVYQCVFQTVSLIGVSSSLVPIEIAIWMVSRYKPLQESLSCMYTSIHAFVCICI